MKEPFDLNTAKFGDSYLNTESGNILRYVGKAPLKRDGEPLLAFQKPNNGYLVGVKLSSAKAYLVRQTPQPEVEVQQPQKRSKTMDKNIAAILRDDTYTVDVNMPDGKNLTYVTNLPVKVGDLVVLPTNSGQYAVRPVAAVHDELRIEPNSEIEYKWIVQVLDLTEYNTNLEKNALIEKTMSSTYQKTARAAFRQSALACASDEDRVKLEAILSSQPKLGA